MYNSESSALAGKIEAEESTAQSQAWQLSTSSLPDAYEWLQHMRGLPRDANTTEGAQVTWKMLDFSQQPELIGHLANSPQLADRELALNLAPSFLEKFALINSAGFYTPENTVEFWGSLRQAFDHRKEFTPSEERKIAESFSYLRTSYTMKQSGSARRAAPLFCRRGCAPECGGAIERSIEMMAPVNLPLQQAAGSPVFALTQEWQEIATDPIYVQAAAGLALKIKERIEGAKKEKVNLEADLFEDLTSIFSQLSQSRRRSEEMSLKLLGCFATRGVDLAIILGGLPKADINFIVESNAALFTSLTMIGVQINVLDHMMLSHGSKRALYSLPKSFSANINYNRPYHFWMSAYLAEKLKQEGFSSEAILEGVYVPSMLYEIFGAVRSKSKFYRDSLEIGDFYRVELAKNMIFNWAGIQWIQNRSSGTYSPAQPYDLDADFLEMASKEPSRKYRNLAQIFRLGPWFMRPFLQFYLWLKQPSAVSFVNQSKGFHLMDRWHQSLENPCSQLFRGTQ